MQVGGCCRVASQYWRVQNQAASGAKIDVAIDCNDIRALQLDLVESTGLKLARTDTGRAVGWRARQGVGGPGGEGEDTIVGREWDRGATDRSIRVLGTIV